jgi:D-tyrosyl-tRNA(Tyr) deacylase
MRAVVQRVSRSKVTVSNEVVGEISQGVMVLLGVTHDDTERSADYLVDKIVNLRIFNDADGKMNLSLADMSGEMLVVSQFTLYGDTRRGRRPSFIDAAAGDVANSLYEYFVAKSRASVHKVATGVFGAMMDVELVNEGPVTIIIDSKNSIQ